MPKLTPKLAPNGKGYIVEFRHPLEGKKVARGLGTRDFVQAGLICKDAGIIFDDESLQEKPTKFKLQSFDDRAVVLVFGEERAKEILDRDLKQLPTGEDVDGIAIDLAGGKEELKKKGIEEPDYRKLMRKLRYYDERFEHTEEVEKENRFLREENLQLRAELDRINKKHNIHVTVSIGDALKAYEIWYKTQVKDQTYSDNIRSISSFISTLPLGSEQLLREADSDHLNSWLIAMSGKATQTKLNRKNAVSKFFNFCMSRFKLAYNPIEQILPMTSSKEMKEIHAIDRLEDIHSLLKSLKPDPYFHAWIAFAILAAPRFSEQRLLKIEDVSIEEDYIRLRANKTGRVRKNAIEKSTLLPILETHIERRLSEQKKKNGTLGDKSPYLFPTLAKTRKEKLDGRWNSQPSWFVYWTRTVAECADKATRTAAKNWLARRKEAYRKGVPKNEREKIKLALWDSKNYWSFGPREWRHTAGTLLANCGWGSMEIAKYMGNSPNVADRHYVKTASQGANKRWPFTWQ